MGTSCAGRPCPSGLRPTRARRHAPPPQTGLAETSIKTHLEATPLADAHLRHPEIQAVALVTDRDRPRGVLLDNGLVGEAQRVFQARDLPRSRLAAGARPYDGLEHGTVAEDVFGFERGHDADDEKCDASRAHALRATIRRRCSPPVCWLRICALCARHDA